MPDDLLDDNLALNSSDNVALDGATDQQLDNEQQDQVADGANSSVAQGDTPEHGTLGIVQDVVSKSRDGAASPADGQEAGSKTQGTDTAKKEDNENYSDVPFSKHPRFRQLIREYNVARADATRYQNVQKFMDDNGITADEAANGFTIMAAMKNAPAKAWEMLKPYVQQLLVASGEVLSPDLQKRVEAGELTTEAASEISKERASRQTLEQGQTFAQQRDERRRQGELSESLQNTAMTWCQDRQAKDPNFAAKQQLLMAEIKRLQDGGWKPTTPEGVKDQLEAAYRALPAPRAQARTAGAPTVGQGQTRRISSSGGATGTSQPKPKSTLDIINRVIEARAG